MVDHASHLTEVTAVETAEMAFRRIARRKLMERRVPEDQIDQKLAELLCKGASVQIDVDDILGPRVRR